MKYFLGRRPITTEAGAVYAYELIIKDLGDGGSPGPADDVTAARLMVNAVLDHGLATFAGRSPVIIPLSARFLENPDLICFPPEQAILAIRAGLLDDGDAFDRVDRLRRTGYRVAITDLPDADPRAELISRMDLVIIDASTWADEQSCELARNLAGHRIDLVATEVKTQAELVALADCGFEHFHGSFLSDAPLDTADDKPVNRLAVLRLLRELEDPDVAYSTVEKYVAMDPTLTLRLLRHVNSSAVGLASSVDSIEHAIVMVGLGAIRSWVTLLALANLDSARVETIRAAFVRARFCRLVARERGLPEQNSYFTAGLMSLMEIIVGMPMEDILAESALNDEIKYGVLTRTGPIGEAIQLAADLEEGMLSPWLDFAIPAERLAELYVDAIAWAVETTAVL